MSRPKCAFLVGIVLFVILIGPVVTQSARTNVPRLGIVITDGASNIDRNNTIPEANAARQKDIMLMALGIGGNINQIELTGIANSPSEQFVFNVLDFKNLSSILEEMVSSACEVIPAKPTFIQCAKTRLVEEGTKRYGLECMFRSFPAYDTVLWRVGAESIPNNTKVNSFRSTVKAEKEDNMFMATLVIDEVTDEMYTKEFKLIVTNKLGESNITIALQKGNYSCFGNITKLTPTGASATTASQDSLSVTGVPASNKLVDADLSELTNMKHCYEQAGQNNCIHPALVAALASRESRAGRLLNSTDGYGDNGKAYGILQCDIANSGLGDNCTMFAWDSCEHIDMMVKRVFIDKVEQVQNKHPKWLPERQLQGGVAAYNFGVSNVKTWARLDIGTTGNDYSNDVIARAQRLVNEHGWTYGTETDVPVSRAAGPHGSASTVCCLLGLLFYCRNAL